MFRDPFATGHAFHHAPISITTAATTALRLGLCTASPDFYLVSGHIVIGGRQTPAVTHFLYRVSDFELGEDYTASYHVSSHSVGISFRFHLYFRISTHKTGPHKGVMKSSFCGTLLPLLYGRMRTFLNPLPLRSFIRYYDTELFLAVRTTVATPRNYDIPTSTVTEWRAAFALRSHIKSFPRIRTLLVPITYAKGRAH